MECGGPRTKDNPLVLYCFVVDVWMHYFASPSIRNGICRSSASCGDLHKDTICIYPYC